MFYEAILFLDFDDVLNTPSTLERGELFEMEHIEALNRLLDGSDVRIVITSMWRLGATPEELEDILVSGGAHVNNRVIGLTPYLQGESRGSEIRAWLLENRIPPRNILILDNRNDMEEFNHCLIQPRPGRGLARSDVEKSLELLKRNRTRPVAHSHKESMPGLSFFPESASSASS